MYIRNEAHFIATKHCDSRRLKKRKFIEPCDSRRLKKANYTFNVHFGDIVEFNRTVGPIPNAPYFDPGLHYFLFCT